MCTHSLIVGREDNQVGSAIYFHFLTGTAFAVKEKQISKGEKGWGWGGNPLIDPTSRPKSGGG